MKPQEFTSALRAGALTRREAAGVLASAGLVTVPLVSGRARAEVDLSLLEWNGYEYESFHPEYNAKYGGQPEVTFFSETEDAFQKMRAGFRVDLVHPCTASVKKFRDAGLIKALETDRIPRWPEIIPDLLEVKGVRIEGEYFFCPWDWGFSTVAYNPEVIEVALSACCRYPRTGERSSAVKFRVFISREDMPQFVDYDWLEDHSIKAAEGMMRALLRENINP